MDVVLLSGSTCARPLQLLKKPQALPLTKIEKAGFWMHSIIQVMTLSGKLREIPAQTIKALGHVEFNAHSWRALVQMESIYEVFGENNIVHD